MILDVITGRVCRSLSYHRQLQTSLWTDSRLPVLTYRKNLCLLDELRTVDISKRQSLTLSLGRVTREAQQATMHLSRV